MSDEREPAAEDSLEAAIVAAGVDRAREMYRRFLESDYPDALAMAEEVLKEQPDDVMALAIQSECQSAIFRPPTVPAPGPSEGTGSSAPFDSEAPTAVEITPPPLATDPDVAQEDQTPVYVTLTQGEPSREMCRRFLESDHPAALLLAESVLEANPNDRMARAIAEQCRAALEARSGTSTSVPPAPNHDLPGADEDNTQVSLAPVEAKG